MINITHKFNTLREAVAIARVKISEPEAMAAVKEDRVPKGNIFEFSRAAGLLAIKKTSDLIPDCHPMPIEFAAISYDLET
ncbi:MAG TPA: cyclic pyranopterin monophosphate synthase MoaC, partial [Chitinophagaceae bacterium]|nr:cyclic pyranopterin monophosphate synthase MoaC [Chitinophagaceae bacterium]